MALILRPYQEEAVQAGVKFMLGKSEKPGLIIAPTGSGKSIIPAEIIRRVGQSAIILQPNVEILRQNVDKARQLGLNPTIFSAKAGIKELSELTYATLGSVIKVVDQLKAMGVKHVYVDEAHYKFSAKQETKSSKGEIKKNAGQFLQFIQKLNPDKILGFTASPWILYPMQHISGANYSQLFLQIYIKKTERLFERFVHITQIQDIAKDYWCPINYESWTFDGKLLRLNSNGLEYTEESIQESIRSQQLNNQILKYIILAKDNVRSILVFMDSVQSCVIASNWLNERYGANFSGVVYGEMGTTLRKDVVEGFKVGGIKVAFCHSTLLLGFDYPSLDCVIFGRPTFSLSVYYQAVGRLVRPKPGIKERAFFIDCCNNMQRFGRVEDLRLEYFKGHGWELMNKDNVITGTPLGVVKKRSEIGNKERRLPLKVDIMNFDPEFENKVIKFGAHKGKYLRETPVWYIEWVVENLPRDSRTEDFYNYCRIKK